MVPVYQQIKNFLGGKSSTEAQRTMKYLSQNTRGAEYKSSNMRKLLIETREQHLDNIEKDITVPFDGCINQNTKIVKDTIKSSKCRRVAGIGGIPAELFKAWIQ